jgi:hypothetical protein
MDHREHHQREDAERAELHDEAAGTAEHAGHDMGCGSRHSHRRARPP